LCNFYPYLDFLGITFEPETSERW